MLRRDLGGDLRASLFEGEIVEQVVQVVLGLHQLALAVRALERDEPVLHAPRTRDEHREEPAFAELDELDPLQALCLRPGRRDDPRMAGEVVQRPGRLREQPFDLAARLVGAGLDELLLGRIRRLQVQEHVDVVAIPARGGHPACAGVRLFEETHRLQVRHHRPHRRRGAVDTRQASDRLAAYRLATVDVVVDDGSEDAARALPERRIPLGSGKLRVGLPTIQLLVAHIC